MTNLWELTDRGRWDAVFLQIETSKHCNLLFLSFYSSWSYIHCCNVSFSFCRKSTYICVHENENIAQKAKFRVFDVFTIRLKAKSKTKTFAVFSHADALFATPLLCVFAVCFCNKTQDIQRMFENISVKNALNWKQNSVPVISIISWQDAILYQSFWCKKSLYPMLQQHLKDRQKWIFHWRTKGSIFAWLKSALSSSVLPQIEKKRNMEFFAFEMGKTF